jgi:DNA-binding IclR family transcriptional regulator
MVKNTGGAHTEGSQDSERNRIKSLDMAFTIVEHLYENGATGVSELAGRLDIPKSTAHVYLDTLLRNGYVVKKDGRYRIGYQFLRIGGGLRGKQKLYQVSRPVLKSLAKETGELADLMVEEGGRGVLLYKAETPDAVDDNALIGQYVPLYSTAMGKAILSQLPESRVEEILDEQGMDEFTINTHTSRPELFEELATISKTGVAFNNEERTRGVRAVGAAILSANDEVKGAISVSGPTARMEETRMEDELTDKVLEAKNIIELKMSHY